MVSINPTGLKTLVAENTLSLFKGPQASQLATRLAGAPGIQAASKDHYAVISSLIDKLMDIKSGGSADVSGSAGTGSASSVEPSTAEKAASKAAFAAARGREDTAARAAIPADKRKYFDDLAGGNTWVLSDKPPPGNVEADIQQIRETMLAGMEGVVDNAFYRGLRQALLDGSMKIVPAGELPELGYATFSMTIYNDDGYVQGAAGAGTANLDYVREQRALGTHVSASSLNGIDYALSWSVSVEEKEKGSWAP
jgi:hypothetical protein